MFLLIECGGQLEIYRQLSPTESLDIAHHARRYAVQVGCLLDIDNPTHTGIGADVDITIQPTKERGAAVVWNSRGFYFDDEENE